MERSDFLQQFRFRAELAGAHGIEREYFLVRDGLTPVPEAAAFLQAVKDPAWTYELSGCQVEHRTKPHKSREQLLSDLREGARDGERAAAQLGLRLWATEVGPADMALDVYPHDARYLELARTLTTDVLRAAARVAGVHIHRGAQDLEDALRIHNAVVRHVERFKRMGDHSNGERLRLYEQMARTPDAPLYRSVGHFYEVACAQGFADKPRNCYHWVRISPHGTVELRMFGMTSSDEEILSWVDELERVIRLG